MRYQFTKMHGLGNDFIVLNGVNQSISLAPEEIRALSCRYTGIGFDQCLVIEASQTPEVDFFYRIYNANGEAVGQCGNGARCIARFIQYYRLSTVNPITVETNTARLRLHINPDQSVTVDMGCPRFNPSDIPLHAKSVSTEYVITLPCGEQQRLHALSLGNPHAVILTNPLDEVPVATLGKTISEHPDFPQHVNVGFMHRLASDHIGLRVYERGCGETRACGSGAVAAVAIGRLFYHLDDRVRVSLPGGDLWVAWPDLTKSLFLTGPADFVYEGRCF